MQLKETIADGVAASLRAFATLADANGPNYDAGIVGRLVDERSRFKIWSANVGAYRRGRNSLDHRLRDASYLRSRVLKLLANLVEDLSEARDTVASEGPREGPDGGASSDSDDGNDADDEDGFFTPPTPRAALAEQLASVTELINNLFRLAATIRNPAPHDRFRESRLTDTTHFEPSDIAHVAHKFPFAANATPLLVERLGRAISRRRQYFRYRERRHEMAARGLADAAARGAVAGNVTGEGDYSTAASSIPHHLKDNYTPAAASDAAPGPVPLASSAGELDEDLCSDSGISRTSYATSRYSRSADADDEVVHRPLRIPTMPRATLSTAGSAGATVASKRRADGTHGDGHDGGYEQPVPFECPFCFGMIVVSSRVAWKRHVFADLQPYVCLDPDCPAPDQDFERRRLWAGHVRLYHWADWACEACHAEPGPGLGGGENGGVVRGDRVQSSMFPTARALEGHLLAAHEEALGPGGEGKDELMESMLARAELPRPIDGCAVECPLCGDVQRSFATWARHVGRHQEDLALFGLPSIPGADGDDDEKEVEEVEEEAEEEGEEEEGEDEEDEGDEEDEAILPQLVETCKTTLGADHPDTRTRMVNVAAMYVSQGRWREAVKLFEQVVAINTRTLAEDHPDRLASQHKLARAYQADGQVRKAVELLEQVVAINTRTLAEDHPDRLASQHTLAGAYIADGQVRNAIELLEQVVAIRERVLAEDHLHRLASQHTLAGAYIAGGQVRKAVELLEQVVAIKTTLAENHPSRLVSQHTLAGAYLVDGQVRKAVELLEQVVAINTRTLAEGHPDRLASQHELARAYLADGQVRKAVELLEQVIAIKTTLAKDHPHRLASQHALARAYLADGQVRKAIELLEQVVAIRERVLAEDHPDRLASQQMLTSILQVGGPNNF